MIETVSAFGPLAIAAFAEATRRQMSSDTTRPVVPRRAEPRFVEVDRIDGRLIETEIGGVVPFMAERTEPTADPDRGPARRLPRMVSRTCVAIAVA
jgi:hypothetical protein